MPDHKSLHDSVANWKKTVLKISLLLSKHTVTHTKYAEVRNELSYDLYELLPYSRSISVLLRLQPDQHSSLL